MKKRNWIWMIGLLVSLAVIVSACATPAATEVEEPVQEEMIVEESNEEESTEMEGDDNGSMDDSSDDDVMVDEGDDETETGSGEGESEPAPSVDLPSDEEMMALLEEKVQGGHSTARVLSASYDYEGWLAVLDRMIGYGANINEEERELLAVWLTQRNGQ
jgi:hypothetical protein